jgi:hypothetical protein
MSRALVGALGDGPGEAKKAHTPSPAVASRAAPAATIATRRAGGTGGRAACAGDPVGGPVTVCRPGFDVI